jgi:Zn-dependent protease
MSSLKSEFNQKNKSMKLFGIPVKFEISFFMVAFLLAYSRASEPLFLVEWLLVVLFSILIHELGHALTGKMFGLTPTITFHSLGGLTSWTDAKPIALWQELIITLAGPCAGFLCGAIVYAVGTSYISSASPLLVVAYYDLLWVNIGWSIFNLFPMLPLDGGHAAATLEKWFLKKENVFIAHIVTLLVGGFVV